ncbi:tyrosine-protein phosphatase non-receptor type 22 [Genypterus blacodes]|uniref:tyrosine-protein phosphatase non-receptor type 22 n=1 Tax=Genypterus blacodes TaxID=154954 RepID=UPI003F769405
MEDQAWILRQLLAQLERQEDVDKEDENSLAGEFSRLKRQSIRYRIDQTYPTKVAERQENVKKNRYKDIVPFDHSRVKLTLTTSKNDSDYINASFIKGVSGSRAYIATQGPLTHTVLDFWRMLWEYNIEVIVMACREFEMGKKKCECYWPPKQEETFSCEPFTIYCDSEENKGDYLTRTLRVTYHNCSRTLKQLHYVNWPDHGVPDSIPPILEMLDEMRSYQDHDDLPICIHCSAGCGRTGALCVIDYTWNLLKKQIIPADFSIYGLVEEMRTQRHSLVQTKEQYELVHRTIKLLFENYLQSVDNQASRNEVAAGLSPVRVDSDIELSDLSDELESDLLPTLQHRSNENVAVSPVCWTTSAPLFGPQALVPTQDLQEGSRFSQVTGTSPTLGQTSQWGLVAKERIEESDDLLLLKPLTEPAAATICLTVEDPYFDSPLGSPSSEETPVYLIGDVAPDSQWTASIPALFLNNQSMELNSGGSKVDVPPPIPERTPESYELDVEEDHSEPFDQLAVIIPSSAAAETPEEMGGSPPSPVPPLPERTPESFVLAIDQAPVEQMIEISSENNLNRIGISSEWSGNAKPSTATQNETSPRRRSKSLKGKMTFTVFPAPTTHPGPGSNVDPPDRHSYHPLDPLDPPTMIPQAEKSPPLPNRTPESFVMAKEEYDEKPATCLQSVETTQAPQRVGTSSEWAGTSQPKTFLGAFKNRSKSVRAKSSQQEPLTTVQTLPSAVVAGGGSAQVGQSEVNHRPFSNAEMAGNKTDKSNEKGMSRTRSIKIFKHKLKIKTAPSSSESGSVPTSSVFKFGFGNRFGKPKGPRAHPESWV